jgi:hypothetical protein
MGSRGKMHDSFGNDKMRVHSVNPVRPLMKPIEAEFILYIKQDQNTAGNAYGQSGNIQKRIEFIPRNIP